MGDEARTRSAADRQKLHYPSATENRPDPDVTVRWLLQFGMSSSWFEMTEKEMFAKFRSVMEELQSHGIDTRVIAWTEVVKDG